MESVFLQTSYNFVKRYSYPTFCVVGFGVATKGIYNEHQKGEKGDFRVTAYSFGYALSCALEVGLDFKILPYPHVASLASGAAFLVGGSVRFEVESDEPSRVGQATSLLDMTNAFVYIGLGSNRFSLALSVLSPTIGLWSK